MDYKLVAYVGIGLLFYLILRRVVVAFALKSAIQKEISDVVHNEENKVKGRYE